MLILKINGVFKITILLNVQFHGCICSRKVIFTKNSFFSFFGHLKYKYQKSKAVKNLICKLFKISINGVNIIPVLEKYIDLKTKLWERISYVKHYCRPPRTGDICITLNCPHFYVFWYHRSYPIEVWILYVNRLTWNTMF